MNLTDSGSEIMSKHLAGSTVSMYVCVKECVCVPTEIYCNVSGEVDGGL